MHKDSTPGASGLIEYHKKCACEFRALLKEFNLLFYGFGCKSALLKAIFPQARLFNLNLLTIRDIVDELILDGLHVLPNASLHDIDSALAAEGLELILILINFDFSCRELQNLQQIRLIGTIENADFTLDFENVIDFNFIFRDLTTFENYTDEVLDIDITTNNVQSALMVAQSVTARSRSIFRELLVLGSCSIATLFNKVSKSLLLSKQQTVIKYLDEFIDHGLIKIKDGSKLSLQLNKEERAAILKEAIMAE